MSMAGKRYYRALGQSHASVGLRIPVHVMRPWPQWAFDAYAWGWLHQQRNENG